MGRQQIRHAPLSATWIGRSHELRLRGFARLPVTPTAARSPNPSHNLAPNLERGRFAARLFPPHLPHGERLGVASWVYRSNVVNDPRLSPQPESNCRSWQRRIGYVVRAHLHRSYTRLILSWRRRLARRFQPGLWCRLPQPLINIYRSRSAKNGSHARNQQSTRGSCDVKRGLVG